MGRKQAAQQPITATVATTIATIVIAPDRFRQRFRRQSGCVTQKMHGLRTSLSLVCRIVSFRSQATLVAFVSRFCRAISLTANVRILSICWVWLSVSDAIHVGSSDSVSTDSLQRNTSIIHQFHWDHYRCLKLVSLWALCLNRNSLFLFLFSLNMLDIYWLFNTCAILLPWDFACSMFL